MVGDDVYSQRCCPALLTHFNLCRGPTKWWTVVESFRRDHGPDVPSQTLEGSQTCFKRQPSRHCQSRWIIAACQSRTIAADKRSRALTGRHRA